MVIKEKNTEPSQAGYGDKVFRAVDPIAEGGSEVHQAGNREIFFGRTGRDRARKEERNREKEKEGSDPSGCRRPSVNGHEICDNSFELTVGQLLA
jgi:hypothetical protein